MRDRTKLPKWAQDELTRLESDVARWKAKYEAGPADSDTFADDYLSRRPLGTGERIVFVIEPGKVGHSIERRIDARLVGRELEVHGYADSLAIIPSASNHVKVRLADYHER